MKTELKIVEEVFKEIEKIEGIKLEIPIEHFFAPGMYGRMMIMPKGSALIGKTHKHETIGILLEGAVRVMSKHGIVTLNAPYILNVKPGDKRAFHALTRVKYMIMHATTETDLAKIEAEMVED